MKECGCLAILIVIFVAALVFGAVQEFSPPAVPDGCRAVQVSTRTERRVIFVGKVPVIRDDEVPVWASECDATPVTGLAK